MQRLQDLSSSETGVGVYLGLSAGAHSSQSARNRWSRQADATTAGCKRRLREMAARRREFEGWWSCQVALVEGWTDWHQLTTGRKQLNQALQMDGNALLCCGGEERFNGVWAPPDGLGASRPGPQPGRYKVTDGGELWAPRTVHAVVMGTEGQSEESKEDEQLTFSADRNVVLIFERYVN